MRNSNHKGPYVKSRAAPRWRRVTTPTAKGPRKDIGPRKYGYYVKIKGTYTRKTPVPSASSSTQYHVYWNVNAETAGDGTGMTFYQERYYFKGRGNCGPGADCVFDRALWHFPYYRVRYMHRDWRRNPYRPGFYDRFD